MEKAGLISYLLPQPEYKCKVNGVHVCTYFGDFRYFDKKKNCEVVEDVKGFKTAEYKLKKKLVEALFQITITEVMYGPRNP